MKPGQRLTRWWQEYVAGRLRTPQDLCACARAEIQDGATPEQHFFGRDLDEPWNGPERLKAPGFIRSTAYLRLWERADWQNVDRRLMRWAAMVQLRARKQSIPLYVHTAYRTPNEQREMAARGVSKTLHSAHMIGEAVDIVHGVYHWEMTRDEWRAVYLLGEACLRRLNDTLPKPEKLHLEWGGDWSFYDPAHWQIKGYKDRMRILTTREPVRLTPGKALSLTG